MKEHAKLYKAYRQHTVYTLSKRLQNEEEIDDVLMGVGKGGLKKKKVGEGIA